MDLSAFAPELDMMHDQTVHLFSKVPTPSDYIGDGYDWQPAGAFQCSTLPVTDKLTIETYGPRVNRMKLLHAAPGANIADGMGVSLTESTVEPDYTVVTVKHRMTHTYVLIEVDDVGSQSTGAGQVPEEAGSAWGQRSEEYAESAAARGGCN